MVLNLIDTDWEGMHWEKSVMKKIKFKNYTTQGELYQW